MKIYNLVLALMLVVIMAGAVSAAVPTISIGTVTIASDQTERVAPFTATDPDGGTMTYSVVSAGDASIATCEIPNPAVKSLKVIRHTENASSTTCMIQAVDNQSEPSEPFTFTVSVERKSMLTIDDIDLSINEDSQDLDDGDDFDAVPGDVLEFKLKITNDYSGDDDLDQDIEIENVDITIDIEDWDDGDNEEFESSDSIDIKADDSETITVTIDEIPATISDGSHTVTITAEGRDENGVKHKDTWEIEMNIEKEDEDIQIGGISIEPATVSCNRNIVLNVRLMNAGNDNSDEIVFTAKNSQLGISLQDYDIELDEGDSDTFEYSIKISDSAAPGVYPIKLATYFDMDRFDDDDVSNLKTFQLTVAKCEETTTPTTPANTTGNTSGGDVVVVTPTNTTTTPTQPDGEEEVKSIFGISEKALIIGLVILNLLLLIAIIMVIAKLLSN